MTHVVRTTNQPDKEITVDDRELLDLQRQGLLIEDKGGKKKDTGSGSGSGSGGTSNTNTGS